MHASGSHFLLTRILRRIMKASSLRACARLLDLCRLPLPYVPLGHYFPVNVHGFPLLECVYVHDAVRPYKSG